MFVFRDFLKFPTVSLTFKVLLDTCTYFMKLLKYNTSQNFVNIVEIPIIYAANRPLTSKKA